MMRANSISTAQDLPTLLVACLLTLQVGGEAGEDGADAHHVQPLHLDVDVAPRLVEHDAHDHEHEGAATGSDR